MEFYVERQMWSGAIKVFARVQHDGVPLAVIQDKDGGLEYVPIHEGQWPTLLTLSDIGSTGQGLFDALWAAGFRPPPERSEQASGQIAALKDHLADMRKLVFEPRP